MSSLQYYHESQALLNLTLRVDKANSSFVYFTFESNEGLCFYSTFSHEIGQQYRDINVYCTIEFKEELYSLLKALSKSFELKIIKEEVIKDSL